MEPMALGSPPSSPSSPSANPNFLPAFLMGEAQPSSPKPSAISPTKTPKNVTFRTPLTAPEARTLRQKLFAAQENFPSVMDRVGPPSKGLFDSLEIKQAQNISTVNGNPVMSSTMINNSSFASQNPADMSQVFSPTSPKTYMNESLGKSGHYDKIDSLWVTVLGFPPSAASLVLAQFAQFGAVLEKRFPPQGNWVNIKYSSPLEVARALAFNGKIISNCIMVGVVKHVTNENKENYSLSDSITSPNRARSLRQSYVPPANISGQENVVGLPNVPQKSTGLVTKAMEYVFGW